MLTLCQHHQQYLDSGDDADAGGAIRGTILHQHRHHPTPGVSSRALASPPGGDLGCRPPSHQPGPRILGFLGLLGPGLPPEGQAGFEGPEQQDHLQRDLLALILPWARPETSGHHPQ